MSRDRCPTCGHALTDGGRLTPRELDLLAAWWATDSVKKAAARIGVTEQRAKNLLSTARIRNRVTTNDQLLEMHFASVRSLVDYRMQHNERGTEAA